MEASQNHRHLTETEQKLARDLGAIRRLIDLVGRNADFELRWIAAAGYWVVCEKKNGDRMQIDEGVLDRRRWFSLGAIALVLLAGGVVLAVMGAQDAQKPVRRAVTFATPTWHIGDTARVSIALDASDAAGPATTHGSPCRMEAGATGRIVEIGGPLSDPRGWVELATPRCAGWVSIHRIEAAQ